MALSLFSFLAIALQAAVPAGAGTAGAAFLKIPASAETAAMAGAWGALAEGARAIHSNPAGLSRLKGRGEFAFSHAKWLEDLTHQSAAAAFTSERIPGVLGIGLLRLGTDQKGYDDQDRPTGGFSTSDTALSLGYGRSLEVFPQQVFTEARLIHLGAALKVIRQEVPGVAGTAIAVDLGAQGTALSTPGGVLRVSLSGSNLGPGVRLGGRTFPLPRRIGVGAAYTLREAGLTGSLEAAHVVDEGIVPALGVAWAPVRACSLRAGWRAGVVGEDVMGALTFGVGLDLGRWGLDAAFGQRQGLGSSLRIEIRMGWGE